MLKKFLKFFADTKTSRASHSMGSLERSLEEACQGKVVGPYDAVKDLMDDLLN